MLPINPRYTAGEGERFFVGVLTRIEDLEERLSRDHEFTPAKRRTDFIFDAIVAKNFNDGDLAPELPRARPFIRVMTTRAKFASYIGRPPALGDRYLLVAAPRPGGPPLWTAIENQGSLTAYSHDEAYYLQSAHSLDETNAARSEVSRIHVPSTANLMQYKLTASSSKKRKPPSPKGAIKPNRLFVEAIDVGQASFISIHNGINSLFFYDVGRPLWFNWRSLPPNPPLYLPPTRDAIVVLSHWDYDHFVGFRNDPALLALRWIAPVDGPTGANAKRLTGILGSRLTKLPYGKKMKVGPLSLSWATCGDLTDFNNRGIVARVKINSQYILLTGDASYAHVASAVKASLSGLSVPHHAAESSHAAVPTPVGSSKRAVMSTGKPNVYGHPSQLVINAHSAWNVEATGRINQNARGNRLIF